MQIHLPIGIKDSGSYIADIHRSRAKSAQSAHQGQHTSYIVHVVVGVHILIHRESGRYHSLVYVGVGSNSDAVAIQVGTLATHGMKQLIQIGSQHHSHHRHAPMPDANRHTVHRQAGIIVGGAVNGVDYPLILTLAPLGPRFLRENGVLRIMLMHIAYYGSLREFVGYRHNIAVVELGSGVEISSAEVLKLDFPCQPRTLYRIKQ